MLNWLLRRKQNLQQRLDPAPPPPPAAAPTAMAAPAANADELMRKAWPMHQAGDIVGAEAIYREILALQPDYADAHYLLGRIAQDRQAFDQAIQHVRQAIRCNDREVNFQRTLGELHFGLGHWDEAAVYFGNATSLEPADVDSWNNLGCAYEKLRNLAEATRCFERVMHLSQESPMALNNYAMALRDRGRAGEAIPWLRKAHEKAPEDSAIFSNYLYTLNFSPKVTPAECFAAHLEFDAVYGSGRHGLGAGPDTGFDPDRRLRVAYFSPDLRSHPIQVFIRAPLERHDRKAFEVTCYHLYPYGDVVTAELKALADRWVECRGLSDEQLAERIVQDRIDILVDLAGHTGDNRLAVLGRKPAPVIATWLGYPNTTGLRTVDYKLTDATCDPPGRTEALHTETLVRLPQQWCYATPEVEAPVTPLPALTRGQVCFGVFNHASKISDDMMHLWVRILRELSAARLFVWGVGEEPRTRIRGLLAGAGLDPNRADFSDRTSFPKQVAMYQDIDIALDTYPYSGVTTTFNSLWMGVPVVTLAGATSASCSTASIEQGLGLGDWVGHDPDGYVALAVTKGRDVGGLAELRRGLRERLQGSAFMDAKGFTRHLEDAYRRMWRARCQTGGRPS